jgi:hypothetical protein
MQPADPCATPAVIIDEPMLILNGGNGLTFNFALVEASPTPPTAGVCMSPVYYFCNPNDQDTFVTIGTQLLSEVETLNCN